MVDRVLTIIVYRPSPRDGSHAVHSRHRTTRHAVALRRHGTLNLNPSIFLSTCLALLCCLHHRLPRHGIFLPPPPISFSSVCPSLAILFLLLSRPINLLEEFLGLALCPPHESCLCYCENALIIFDNRMLRHPKHYGQALRIAYDR